MGAPDPTPAAGTSLTQAAPETGSTSKQRLSIMLTAAYAMQAGQWEHTWLEEPGCHV